MPSLLFPLVTAATVVCAATYWVLMLQAARERSPLGRERSTRRTLMQALFPFPLPGGRSLYTDRGWRLVVLARIMLALAVAGGVFIAVVVPRV